jgi:hypothetical protein
MNVSSWLSLSLTRQILFNCCRIRVKDSFRTNNLCRNEIKLVFHKLYVRIYPAPILDKPLDLVKKANLRFLPNV